MGLANRIIKAAIEGVAYRKCLEQLDTMTEEQINVDYVMKDFRNLSEQDKANLVKANLTEKDILDIAKSIVPKLLKEKRKRVR